MVKLRMLLGAWAVVCLCILFCCGCKDEGSTIIIPINSPPTVAAIPGQVADEGVAFALDLTTYVTDDTDVIADLNFTVLSGGGSFTGAVYNNTFTTAGTIIVSFAVSDTGGAMTLASFTVTVNATTYPPLVITTSSLPAAVAMASYSQQLAAQGGLAPYTWDIVGGSIPAGLTMDIAGLISGIPINQGTFSFTVKCTDSRGVSTTRAFSIDVTRDWTHVSGRRPGIDHPDVMRLCAMTYDSARGVVVLFSGDNGFDDYYYGETWEYDGTSWALASTGGPDPRRCSAMAYDSTRGVVVMFGGAILDDNAFFTDTWEWDGTTWKNVSPAGTEGVDFPEARRSHTMAFDGTNMLLFGGYHSTTGTYTDTWAWNGTIWSEVTPATSPAARIHHSMAYDGANVVLFGGYDWSTYLGDTWVWNGSTWTDVSPTTGTAGIDFPEARHGHRMAYDGTNVVLFGGFDDYYWNYTPMYNDTWAWNGSAWTEITTANAPAGRRHHGMAYDSTRGVVVVYGGQVQCLDYVNYYACTTDTWEFDGVDWSNTSPPQPGDEGTDYPTARRGQQMVYDSARGVSVLFSGNDNATWCLDVWEWDGSIWTKIPISGTPGVDFPVGRRHPAVAYDSVRGVVVLFGGMNENLYYHDDTWEWDGSSWTDVSPSGTAGTDFPIGRRRSAMVYDSIRGVTVLFGGNGVGNSDRNDTWEWNGTTWTEVTSAGSTPSTRDQHAMVYHNAFGAVVMFGGNNNSDTWLWDGNEWVDISPPGIEGVHYPNGRDGHAMAFDNVRGKVVLFGGLRNGSIWDDDPCYGDTWELDSSGSTKILPTPGLGNNAPIARRQMTMAFDSARGVTVMFGGQYNLGGYCSDTWEY